MTNMLRQAGEQVLTPGQMADYDSDGFLVLRGRIPEIDIERLERGLARNPPLDGTLGSTLRYPEPGRYTLANQCLKDPDLAFLVEHPDIVPVARQLLGDEPRLSAYVIYDRTPGGPGLPPHHDYKRWRPVGSSMNWLFTIVPMCDFTAGTGRLYVAPGSHRLERIHPGRERPLEVDPAIRPKEGAFIDPELHRGDLLLMNMHLWHKADPNQSNQHRVGVFNKYAAASAPPATGYFLYDEEVAAALSEDGRQLLGVHSNLPITTTRLLLLKEGDEPAAFVMDNGQLPGGPTWDERAIPDWDLGNMIAPLAQHVREQLAVETPWVSWIGDYEEGEGLCRTYGYTLTGNGFPVPYSGGEWRSLEQVRSQGQGFAAAAFESWLDPALVRGKGLTQAQCRVDQFAY